MKPYRKLQTLLDSPATETPEKIAIRHGTCDVSYSDLQRQTLLVAGALRRRGVQPGDRVAWFLPNCLEAVLITLACYRLGAISLPLNYRYQVPEIQYVLESTGSQWLIFHADHGDVVEKVFATSDSIKTVVVSSSTTSAAHVPFESFLEGESLTDVVTVGEDDPALILYTSGSTGRPKGVTHSHAGAFAGIDISRRIFELDQHDIVLVGKPISHAGGLETQLMPALQAGAEVVLAMKPQPSDAIDLIARHSVTQYAMLASDLLDFVEYLERQPTDLSSLQVSMGSGDAVPHELHHRFRDLFGWEVMEGCGMTEIGGYYAVNPRNGTRKWGSMGSAVPDTKIRIVNSEDQDVPFGEVGEIIVRTPSATVGYWQDSETTAELFHDGWLHSGDLARIDEDGYLWFVGRRKLMIVRRGSNIAPAEVEDVIDEHPKVHASVVVGVPDPHDGHVPVACVAPLQADDRPTEEELRHYMADLIAAYKVPVQFLFFDELPRNSTGKLDRHRLEEIAIEKAGREAGPRA